MVYIESVYPQLDRFFHHRLQGGKPVRIAHTTAICQIRTTFDIPSPQGPVREPLLGVFRASYKGASPRRVFGVQIRLPSPEQPLSAFVVSVVPRHAHLPDHVRTSRLELRDKFCCARQGFLSRRLSGIPTQWRSDLRIIR